MTLKSQAVHLKLSHALGGQAGGEAMMTVSTTAVS